MGQRTRVVACGVSFANAEDLGNWKAQQLEYVQLDMSNLGTRTKLTLPTEIQRSHLLLNMRISNFSAQVTNLVNVRTLTELVIDGELNRTRTVLIFVAFMFPLRQVLQRI